MIFSSRPGCTRDARARVNASCARREGVRASTKGASFDESRDAPPLERSGLFDAPARKRVIEEVVESAIAEHPCDTSLRPRDVRTFDAARVSVERGGVPVLKAQRAFDKAQGVKGDLTPLGSIHHSSRVDVAPSEERLIAQHLFEVRHVPFAVDAVARESATEMVVEAAARHRVERDGNGIASSWVVEFEQCLDEARSRKLGRSAETPVGINLCDEIVAQSATHCSRGRATRARGPDDQRSEPLGRARA